jgi:hypothetical protein
MRRGVRALQWPEGASIARLQEPPPRAGGLGSTSSRHGNEAAELSGHKRFRLCLGDTPPRRRRLAHDRGCRHVPRGCFGRRLARGGALRLAGWLLRGPPPLGCRPGCAPTARRAPSRSRPRSFPATAAAAAAADGTKIQPNPTSPHPTHHPPTAGASGDLARKKTFPALQFLHANGFLPRAATFLGYARSALTTADLCARLRPHLAGGEAGCDADDFLKKVSYVAGDYESAEGFKKLAAALEALEGEAGGGKGKDGGDGNGKAGARPVGRLFYLALPPAVYGTVARGLKEHCAISAEGGAPPGSWTRLVVEKPFGRDLASSEALADELGALWPERSLYRIDHYLGKELLQSLFVMRFGGWWLGGGVGCAFGCSGVWVLFLGFRRSLSD